MEKKSGEKHNMKKCSEEPIKKYFGFGVRHVQMASMCGCMIALFVARGSITIAVLAMTDRKRLNDSSVLIYDWDKKTQGLILSSFFWGYMVMQIPAGILAKRFGGKPILLVALLASGAICLLLPTLAQVGGWKMVCVCRVAMGLTQACLYPGSHTLLGRWLPAHERTSYTGIVYGGSHLGTIIAMPLSGLLAETAIGWKLIFYSTSGLMFVTGALWYWLTASTPGQHPWMSLEERQYIENGLSTSGIQGNLRTPWKEIFKTGPLWAIMVTHVGCASGFTFFFVDMPTYLERGLQIPLKNSATISALPYVGMWVGGLVSTYVCEKIYNKGLLSILTCRKIFNSIGLFGIAAGLVGLSFLGPENKTLAIVTLIGALTMSGFCSAGFVVNHLDLSPNFAGVMLSLTNFAANFGTISTPIFTSFILKNDPTDISRWRIVFLSIAALSIVSNIVYVVFGSTERQEWDDPDYFDRRKADPEEMKAVLKNSKEEEAKKH